jgi:hypothetical protein
MLISCSYLQVDLLPNPKGKDILELQSKGKYIIIHYEENAWHFNNLSLSNDSLFGTISSCESHQKYKSIIEDNGNRVTKKELDSGVLDEVHIYLQDHRKIQNTNIAFSIRDINKIEVYNADIETTIVYATLSAIGISAFVLSALLLIALATKGQSCPFIYIWDGDKYNFCGEIYSGAVLPALERNDYLPLEGIKIDNGEYKIKISNKVKEIQNTNLTDLLIFEHPYNTKVLVDKYGNIQTSFDLESPIIAVNFQGMSVFDQIKQIDTLSYLGEENSKETDGVILSFNHPKTAKVGKLFIRAKNTMWLDYVIGRFYNLFGDYYKKWNDKQKTVPASKIIEWNLSQNIPLSIYIEINKKWKFVDYYNIAGPMAFKSDVLPIDLSEVDSDTVKLKLISGSFFWDIDYIGIDYTKNIEPISYYVNIKNAIDNNGHNVTGLLNADDNQYYTQPNVGDEAVLTFSAPKATTYDRTVILHSKGYYEILINPNGKIDKHYLEKFSQPNRLPQFSLELLKYKTKKNEGK